MSDLKEILHEIEQHSKNGNRKALSALLKRSIPDRLNYYHESQKIARQEAFADMLYKTLLLELDEEEDESIEMAELAYLGMSEGISGLPEDIYESVKKRVILLHYFADYFTDSLIELFLKKYRKDNLLTARNLALESIARMQLSDLFYIEQHFGERIDKDEQLNDVSNAIEIAPNLSDEELKEADLMHKVLYAYLKVKYKKHA
ncbi:hypothetical protein [uncultured Sanguibacteroides sp.]|uniref:hypothetical protein n=1 Tax=uncultured Sanguibacteroides sp. TaxID=1635151 RepID=UPI0025F426F7|nr:hypothetical protein [uncultured Sanguibacteroides sp.]